MLGVSRQAVSKMIRAGRLRTYEIGGHILVDRREFGGIGRKSAKATQNRPDEAERFLAAFDQLRPEVRKQVYRRLIDRHPIHPFETRVGASAEVILEALERSGPLTIRGLRGVLAESAFDVNVVGQLSGWQSLPTPKDPPYDFLLDDGQGSIKIQVKLQRSKSERPMFASEANRRFSPEFFVVETQRTRGGKIREGEDTRPYRFGEFDILVVAMQASTRDWNHFLYTVGNWLIRHPDNEKLFTIFQPVSPVPNEDWTDDFLTCVAWLRSGKEKTIGGLVAKPKASGDPADSP